MSEKTKKIIRVSLAFSSSSAIIDSLLYLPAI